MEKTEKEGIPIVKRKDLNIGKYTGSLHINEIICKNFTIYPGLTIYCSCGKIDLFERDFIEHLKDHHHEVVL